MENEEKKVCNCEDCKYKPEPLPNGKFYCVGANMVISKSVLGCSCGTEK